MTSSAKENNYDAIAKWYGPLSHLYSCGQIRACKRFQLGVIAPGDRVLYTGVGTGEDAAMAARKGARVTVIDLSPGMVAQARARFRSAGLEGSIEVLCGDVLAHAREGQYDVVASNFFLNVFEEKVMEAMLAHLVRQVRPGGRLLIADFTPAGVPPLLSLARRLYFGLAVRAFGLMANNAIHPLYDYAQRFEALGLRLEEARGFGLLGLGPAFYGVLVAAKG